MGDDGSAEPRLAAALARFDGSAATRAEVLAALAGARLFVAVTARSTAEHVADCTGLRAESSAEMALVSLVATDGARALPAFVDVASLQRWRRGVRPVPAPTADLCRAALDDGATGVLLDPADRAVLLSESDLVALAAGYVPVPGSHLASRWADTELTAPATDPDRALVAALAAALAPERVKAARLLDGPSGPVLGVTPGGPLDPAQLAALASRVAKRLGPSLPAEGLDLAVVPEKGPGVPVTGRGR
jgi:hypothetical protein